MLEVGRDAHLAQKPVDAEHGTELGIENLDRDLPAVLDVPREIDRRHAAAADLPLDGVAVGQGGVKLGENVHEGRQLRQGSPERKLSCSTAMAAAPPQ